MNITNLHVYHILIVSTSIHYVESLESSTNTPQQTQVRKVIPKFIFPGDTFSPREKPKTLSAVMKCVSILLFNLTGESSDGQNSVIKWRGNMTTPLDSSRLRSP